MTFKITAQDWKQIGQNFERLATLKSELEDAVAELNEKVKQAYEELDPVIEQFKGAVEETRSHMSEIVETLQDEYNDKSERWQESDRGQAVQEWLDVLSSYADDLQEPDAPTVPDDLELDSIVNFDPEEILNEISQQPD